MPGSAAEYLASHFLLVLATAGADGTPHAAPMFYAPDGLRIYLSAPADSRTARNLEENPRAAVALADMPTQITDAQSVQLEGAVTAIEGDEASGAADLFGRRYPFLGDAVRQARFFRLDPAEVTYVHNDRPGDIHFEALGQEWERESVPVDEQGG
jgi:uncharacterized protein YhbP (UPF0306 family)